MEYQVMFRSSGIAIALASIVIATSLTGCATFNAAFGKKMPRATSGDPVVEIICLWQPGEGRDPDGIPCKGFLGQVMFLNSSTSTPVVMEGSVRIYLFDDQGTPEEQAKPLRIFDFPDGPWQIHLTETAFGPSYSVFVPYVRRGVTEANCALRVRFNPKQGSPVFSDITNMSLTGHTRTIGVEAKPITRVDLEKQTVDAVTGSLLRTTTISTGPTGSTPQTANTLTAANPPAQANPIQLAAHEVPAPAAKDSAETERIKRLEAMMEKLLEQKAAVPTTAVPTQPERNIVQASLTKRAEDRSIDASTSSRRFVIRRSEEAEPQRSAPARRRHPLDDDGQEPSRLPSDDQRVRRSPLDDGLDESVETTYLPRSSMNSRRYRQADE
jgi:hypothetical protein